MADRSRHTPCAVGAHGTRSGGLLQPKSARRRPDRLLLRIGGLSLIKSMVEPDPR